MPFDFKLLGETISDDPSLTPVHVITSPNAGDDNLTFSSTLVASASFEEPDSALPPSYQVPGSAFFSSSFSFGSLQAPFRSSRELGRQLTRQVGFLAADGQGAGAFALAQTGEYLFGQFFLAFRHCQGERALHHPEALERTCIASRELTEASSDAVVLNVSQSSGALDTAASSVAK